MVLGGNPPQDPARVPAGRICVLDADTHRLDSLAHLLHQSGYEVIAGRYGEPAHAMRQDGAIDLIVLNLESSGGMAAQALKDVRIAQPDVPWIVTAAHASAESALAAIKVNVVDYIVKTYEPSDLLLTISKALGGTPATRPSAAIAFHGQPNAASAEAVRIYRADHAVQGNRHVGSVRRHDFRR